MHHGIIEEKLDGYQPPLQPFNRSPLQAVNRPTITISKSKLFLTISTVSKLKTAGNLQFVQ